MKSVKSINKSKVNSSYLNRLKSVKKTIKKYPLIYANDKVSFNSVSIYKRGELIEQFTQKA